MNNFLLGASHSKRRTTSLKNFLILGASGGVATALLQEILPFRNAFNKLILLDKNSDITTHTYINHKELNYSFLFEDLSFPGSEQRLRDIILDNDITTILDITDINSMPILTIANELGVSYINTAMNDDEKTVVESVLEVNDQRNLYTNASHILCTGMNPGVVNMWVRHGIEKHGKPLEIIHWEYDTGILASGWKPMSTWSLKELIVEIAGDPSGIMHGRNNIEILTPNALHYRVDMKSILSPIMKLAKYPYGFTVIHEENVSITQQYDIPSKFIYAFYPKTMDYLIKTYKKKGEIVVSDLIHGENIRKPLKGADTIGVLLKYEDKEVYYWNSIKNSDMKTMSATYKQVVIGIIAALGVLLFEKIDPGIHFVEELYNTSYKDFLFENMIVTEEIFTLSTKKKVSSERVVLQKSVPTSQKRSKNAGTSSYQEENHSLYIQDSVEDALPLQIQRN